MNRILFLLPGEAPPNKDPHRNQFYYLSRYFSGHVIKPIWWDKTPQAIARIKDAQSAMGNFQYHPIFRVKLPKPIQIFYHLFSFIYKGARIYYSKEKYGLIFTYGVYTTGIAGYILKILTRAKLIVMVPTALKKSYLYDLQVIPKILKFKGAIANILAPFILNRADCIYSIAPSLLDGFRINKNIPISIFLDFVATSSLQSSKESDKYILLLGLPWYLKGADILINAFNLISGKFPEYSLKIVGHCPDKKYFQKIAAGNDKIELCDAVPYDEAMRLMSRCALYVLASRLEGMGRVLLEAMALKKPIIASNVDGVSYYIKDGFNGLLFESENVKDLAKKITTLLRDPDYALKLAENGHKYVHQYCSEDNFVEHFKKMIDEIAR